MLFQNQVALKKAKFLNWPVTLTMCICLPPHMVKRMTQIAKAQGETGAGIEPSLRRRPYVFGDIIEAVDHLAQFSFRSMVGENAYGHYSTVAKMSGDRTHPNWKERLKSVGRAQSTVEVQIEDENGNILPVGDIGEIMVRGELVMPGYWKIPRPVQNTA